jgi:hypothetical protein
MAEEIFTKLLARAYRGEISGEALFSDLSERFHDQADKLRLLALLERKMAQALQPLLVRYGVDGGDDEHSRRTGHRSAVAASANDWPGFLRLFDAVTTDALDRYHELNESSSEGSGTLKEIALLIEHEEALRQFAQAEMEGFADRSLDPIRSVLAKL